MQPVLLANLGSTGARSANRRLDAEREIRGFEMQNHVQNHVWERHSQLYQRSIPDPRQHELSAPELAQFVSVSLEKHALFSSELAREKHVPQLTVFTYTCAPRRASAEGLRAAAEFLFVFFLLNDYWVELTKHEPHSTEAPPDPRLSFISTWLDSLSKRFERSPARFLSGFETYRQSLFHEQELLERAVRPSRAEYTNKQNGRYQWVATPPYIDLWELTEGILLPEELRPPCERIKEISVELTYLANDMGSIARDRRGMNFVSILAAERELSLEEALRETAELYLDQVQLFSRLSEELHDEEAQKYVDLLAHVTDGNLRSTLYLASSSASGRYAPEARALLDQLHQAGRLVRS